MGAMIGVAWFGVQTPSNASLGVLGFWVHGPIRLRVSTCVWIRVGLGAFVGSVCNSSLGIMIRAVVPFPSWGRSSVPGLPTRGVFGRSSVSVGSVTEGRFMLGFMS